MKPIAYDSRGDAAPAPIWLLSVQNVRDGQTAMVGIEANTADLYEGLRLRMRRRGFKLVTPHEWNIAVWAHAPTAAVDVVNGELIRITTGAASVYAMGGASVSPLWVQAARARRVLVALMPPGTLDDAGSIVEQQERMFELVSQRKLLGAMVTCRFDLPVSRPR